MEKRLFAKFDFWNFFLGLVIGFAAGVILINALVPNAPEMIRLYGLDRINRAEAKALQQGTSPVPNPTGR